MSKSKNGWVITWVNTEILGADEVGVFGPRATAHSKSIIESDGAPFMMCDDDGNPYYMGQYLGDPFAPLDNFGRPNAGCTEVYIRHNGRWQLV